MKKHGGRALWWAWRIGAAAVLGATTTLAVAYGGAVVNSEVDFGGYGDGDLYTMRQTNTWWDVVTCVGDPGAEAAVARVRAVRDWDGDTLAAVVRDGAASGQWPRDVIMIGWPARCLWGAKGGETEAGLEGLREVPEWLESIRFVHNPLPLRVWWPGVGANVGLFGGGWLLLLAGPGVARRWWRRRHGGCSACGYDVRGVAVCPECGMAAMRAGP